MKRNEQELNCSQVLRCEATKSISRPSSPLSSPQMKCLYTTGYPQLFVAFLWSFAVTVRFHLLGGEKLYEGKEFSLPSISLTSVNECVVKASYILTHTYRSRKYEEKMNVTYLAAAAVAAVVRS